MYKTNYFNNKKYFEVVKMATGLLMRKERIKRINEISEYNILLAAKCKNTNATDENIIVNSIINLALKQIEESNHILSYLSLIELKEYLIIYKLIKPSFSKGKNYPFYCLMLNHTIEYSSIEIALPSFFKNIPPNIKVDLLNNLLYYGYNLDIRSFNFLLSKETEHKKLISKINEQGLKLNFSSYYNLLIKEKDSYKVKTYFNLIVNIIKSDDYSISKKKAISYTLLAYGKYLNYFPDFDLSFFNSLLKRLTIIAKDDVFLKKSIYINIIKAIPFLEIKLHYYNILQEIAIIPETVYYYLLKEIKTEPQHFDIFCKYIGDYHFNTLSLNKKTKDSKIIFRKVIKSTINNFSNISYLERIIIFLDAKSIKLDTFLLIEYVKCYPSFKSINFLTSNFNITSDDSKKVFYLIKSLDQENNKYFLRKLIEINFEFNLFICNIFFKKIDFEVTSLLFKWMKSNNLPPDHFSFTPLLQKVNSISELVEILVFAFETKYKPDDFNKELIKQKISIDTSSFLKIINKYNLSEYWKDILIVKKQQEQ